MNMKEIHWRRGEIDIVLEPDRKALVPLLRQTALDSVPMINSLAGGVAFDGTFLWVTKFSGKLSKIDVAKNQEVATVGVGIFATGVAFDGAFIWVCNNNDDTVSKIDIV